MTVLEKQGYRISIESWVGKLGNHLIQLSGALNVAKHTHSVLTIPDHPVLRQRIFDFREWDHDNCNEKVEGRFFFKADCFQFPFEFDSDRRAVFQEHVLDLLLRKTARERIVGALRRATAPMVTPDTLVINMRSGRDIFRTDPPPLSDYMQPPLSFYQHIIESGSYEDCLIVTEPARANPCVDALLASSSRVRIKSHVSVNDDLRTILSARHLVLCHSTFSWCLALMSRNLERLHQPNSFQIRGVRDFATDTYSFNDYIEPGQWTCSSAQLEKMVRHSTDDVTVVHKAKGESPDEPSNFW